MHTSVFVEEIEEEEKNAFLPLMDTEWLEVL